MKLKTFLLLPVLVAAFAIACKKNKGDNKNQISNVEGYWAGAYGYSTSPPSYKMSVIFRNNGSIKVYYGYNGTDTARAAYKLEGTYTLSNSVLTFKYNENSLQFIHKADLTIGTAMEGTWGQAPSNTDGGLFSLVRM